MSSSELAEAGVLGLEDYVLPTESDSLCEPRSAASVGETKASEDDDGHCTEAATGADALSQSMPDLLTELRKVHALDELIMEENLKIHMFRHKKKPNEELSRSKSSDPNGPSMNKEREASQLQLEKERGEVDKLENSLGKGNNVKKQDGAKKVMKCSIMEKGRTENKDDRALCHKLLSGSYNRPQRTFSSSLVCSDSQVKDTFKTKCIQAVLGPDGAKEATPQDTLQVLDSQCQDHCSKTETSVFNRPTSDLKAPSEEVGIQPQGCFYSENIIMCKPEASLTPEMKPDDGAFDPGGKWHLLPVPKPRKASLPMNDNLVDNETPHSAELQIPALSSVAQDHVQDPAPLDLQDQTHDAQNVTLAVDHNLVLNANAKEHSNNNNNHTLTEKWNVSLDLSETTTTDKENTSVVPACLLQTDLHPAEEIKMSSPIDECPPRGLPPDQPLELDLGGKDEQIEDLPDGVRVQSSEDLRVSDFGSPRIQAQLNINMREVCHLL